MKKGKCNFRKWGSYDSKADRIIHNWYCKVHKTSWSSFSKKKTRRMMKLHWKAMKHAK